VRDPDGNKLAMVCLGFTEPQTESLMAGLSTHGHHNGRNTGPHASPIPWRWF
jgi:hypothetical protein